MIPALLRRRRSGNPFAVYAANGFQPEMVMAPQDGRYRDVSGATTAATLLSHSRTGVATYFDSTGVLQTAADGVLRDQHHVYDGGQWKRGLLIESDAATNLVVYSNSLGQQNGVRATLSEDATASPDGTTNAGSITETAVAGDHRLDYDAVSFTSGNSYVLSIYLKADGRSWARVGLPNAAFGTAYANFSLLGGAIGTTTGLTNSYILPLGNGWYRCVLIAEATSTASGGAQVQLATADNVISFTGDGTSGLFVYGADIKEGSALSSYIPTNGSTASRNAETQSVASGKWAHGTEMWGAVELAETYADDGAAAQETIFDIRVDANNRLTLTLDTDGAKTGDLTLTMVNGGVSASAAVSALSPGVNAEAKIAWRANGSEIAISSGGATEVNTATAIGIPAISGADIDFGGNGTRHLITFGTGDVGAAGIEGASA